MIFFWEGAVSPPYPTSLDAYGTGTSLPLTEILNTPLNVSAQLELDPPVGLATSADLAEQVSRSRVRVVPG